MKQLIVNADDFGLTEQVNRGILDAHREGIVTSTTLMANGGAFWAAVDMSHRAPELGIGVHLNLSEGIPVSPAFRIPSLVDARGRLYLTPSRLWSGIVTRLVNLLEIQRELHAQIEKVLGAGISPTHLDGHKHVHVLPGISAVVIRLAQGAGIKSVRCPLEEAPGLLRLLESRRRSQAAIFKQYVVGRAVSRFARRFKERLAQAGLISPAHFYGLSQTGFLDVENVEEILFRLPGGASELMCHPGYVDANLVRTGTRLLTQREVEVRALTALQVSQLAAAQRIRLVSYQELSGSVQASEAAA